MIDPATAEEAMEWTIVLLDATQRLLWIYPTIWGMILVRKIMYA